MEEGTLPEKLSEDVDRLRSILNGRKLTELNLEFLFKQNRTDLQLLNAIKSAPDQRAALSHHGTVMCHAFMQCGTTQDTFIRSNVDWLSKATNWGKFSAVSAMGIIHRGHVTQAKTILQSYLPPETPGAPGGSQYSEGGALYAMGLIHANHWDQEVQNYLLGQLRGAQNNEVLQHGACLGLGLTCMATANTEVYNELKNTLFADTAVGGDAAATAIGLVMLGSASAQAIDELHAYAQDTHHEKIIRSCAVALAMIMFEREEEADPLIEQLLMDKDPILRYGACYTIAMAYCGTSANSAIRKLLHVSVSDVSDDVRRAAVIALGFVMCNDPEKVPDLVKLLSESWNMHVRYASAIAVGIACCGTASKAAEEILEPLIEDSVPMVQQGAYIAMSLIYQQASPKTNEKCGKFREGLLTKLKSKGTPTMTAQGVMIGHGIIDAGGRNVSAKFHSRSGILQAGTAVGFCLFTQQWYWYPYVHCLSLAFHPTAMIGLNARLKMPTNFGVTCESKPSVYGYPEPMKIEEKEKKERVQTAVLSTTKVKKAEDSKKADGDKTIGGQTAQKGDKSKKQFTIKTSNKFSIIL